MKEPRIQLADGELKMIDGSDLKEYLKNSHKESERESPLSVVVVDYYSYVRLLQCEKLLGVA